ncbi:MAG: hypothetical protein MJY58_05010 [Bacteroidaceae bacterium]|nr:hypothetical protein [Bacteroidaceae bacterium]
MKKILLSIITAAVGVCTWCENIPDAVIVTQPANNQEEYCYLLEGEGVVFDIDGDIVGVLVDTEEKSGFTLAETADIDIYLAHTFTLTANQDPDSTDNYYATFFTRECAYILPDDVNAYIGTLGKYKDADVLNLTPTDTIHAGEAVILRVQPANTAGKQTEITLMPSCNRRAASPDNKLTGTDVAIAALGATDYALTLGQNGVGFYNWNGRALGAHKAYLTLSGSQPAPLRSFGFRFDDGTTTGIPAAISDQPQDDAIYNLQGQRVDGSYKGLIIKNGQKVYNY